MKNVTRTLLFVLLMATCIGCDRVTKRIATAELRGSEPVSIAGDAVRLEYAENTGAFLGLGQGLGAPARLWILGIGTAVVLLVVASVLCSRPGLSAWTFTALTLILAGGVGNLVDRLSDGYVVDFMILRAGSVRTGVFNVADVAITTGVAVLCLGSFRARKSNSTGPDFAHRSAS